MPDGKPWFLVMTPDDANRAGSQWLRYGAASRGKIVVRPIAPEGWIALLVFLALLIALPLYLWTGLFSAGRLSAAGAIIATLIAIAVLVVGLIWLIRTRMTRLPPG
jgi:ABC-type amino acid transport system permease subunit